MSSTDTSIPWPTRDAQSKVEWYDRITEALTSASNEPWRQLYDNDPLFHALITLGRQLQAVRGADSPGVSDDNQPCCPDCYRLFGRHAVGLLYDPSSDVWVCLACRIRTAIGAKPCDCGRERRSPPPVGPMSHDDGCAYRTSFERWRGAW